MTNSWQDVQRIVLQGSRWQAARYLVLCFGEGAQPMHFLAELKKRYPRLWPSAAASEEKRPKVQVSLGFSRRGLERARVPAHVLACFALKSPAFWAGAPARANRHLALAGEDDPIYWPPAFDFMALDAVLSLHAMDKHKADLVCALRNIRKLARRANVRFMPLVRAHSLPLSGKHALDKDAQLVHFGYRDGLSRIEIEGWTPEGRSIGTKPVSRHKAGEFLLGHPQDCGANPWIAGPGPRVWPPKLRQYFHNGSFGVLAQIEQDVAGFEAFVRRSAAVALRTAPGFLPSPPAGETRKDRVKRAREEIMGKLCGRYSDGRPLAAPRNAPSDDFDYTQDADGYGCPFGSHVRRMNPRGEAVPHAVRARPLLRRGMPYGDAWCGKADGKERGILGQFFCTSIEDQFEHLVGQWGDRVPIGSADGGGARDPLIGAHEHGDGAFEIRLDRDQRPLRLDGLRPFTRTRGVAYLFYPSLPVLEGMIEERPWFALDKDDLEHDAAGR